MAAACLWQRWRLSFLQILKSAYEITFLREKITFTSVLTLNNEKRSITIYRCTIFFPMMWNFISSSALQEEEDERLRQSDRLMCLNIGGKRHWVMDRYSKTPFNIPVNSIISRSRIALCVYWRFLFATCYCYGKNLWTLKTLEITDPNFTAYTVPVYWRST